MSPCDVAALQCLGVHVAVLVPVKRFSAAKGRLIGTVGDGDRARFARWMASGVIGAVREFPTFVACDDDEVAEWAEHHGAQVIWGEGLGLNGAVDDGIEQIVKHDVDHIIVAHADLPRPANITTVARPGCITLVPDRRRDGTNVMSFPAHAPLRSSYGGGSFGRHLAQARQLCSDHGVSVEVRSDPDLSLDLDTPADLNHPLIREVLPEWLRTNLANR
jgi:2-phospho-L-lactate/phosphoenolpyruvate guanylyltransferase